MEYQSKEKCTIKKRREVARILAARENLPKINDDIIKRVGSMSDNEIINFLKEETAQAVQVLQPDMIEEIKPGAGADYEKIYSLLVDFAKN